jgi:hypothetical protein
MKIAFFIRHFGERGTEVAAYDYADQNEKILGNQSIIIGFTPETYAKHRLTCIPTVLERFQRRFPVFLVSSFAEIDRLLRREAVDVYYTLTHGGIETYPFGDVTACTYAVHCVFETRHPHGDVYACIGPQLNDRFGTSVPVVPHMVIRGKTTKTLRNSLGIPEDAIVFGRHGGMDTFDIQFVHEAVIEVAKADPSRYFLFLNTSRFCDLPNVIHLPMTIDIEEKQAFINTCDAYLHARSEGETFGLSVAEFAISEKPVIAWSVCLDRQHLNILGEKAIQYTSKDSLVDILTTFKRGCVDMTTNGYKEYSPERVMKAFQDLICVRKRSTPLQFLPFNARKTLPFGGR